MCGSAFIAENADHIHAKTVRLQVRLQIVQHQQARQMLREANFCPARVETGSVEGSSKSTAPGPSNRQELRR